MLELSVIIGAAVLCCSALLVFNCVCHIFRRRGFSSFENDVEGGGDVSMYPANASAAADVSGITFEPLPDILAKTVSSRALRPRITNLDKDKQASAAKLVTIYRAFPRSQLLYIKEIGLGWFGQVLQGDADRIVSGNRKTRVVVKILKDDSSPAEKRLFLEEVTPYRELQHENILQLLGQCTETTPFLNILEYPIMGDLKCYLIANKKGPLIQFMLDAASGLAFMHSNGYVHHDFSARNCLLTSEYKLKIGDYGIAEDVYREDYYDTGRDLLPIRWMAPESLQCDNGVWQVTSFTVSSNVWSLGVMMWETLELGGKPYSSLTDEEILQKVVNSPEVRLPQPNSTIAYLERWYEVMEMCWQEADGRPSAGDIVSFLKQIQHESSPQIQNEEFDSKWKQAKPSEPRVVQVDQPVASSQSQKFESDFVSKKPGNQSNSHVTEVIVHRIDEDPSRRGFEDNFVKLDEFNDTADLSQNDSILAYGGNPSETEDSSEQERYVHIMYPDPNMNLMSPVPMVMSTPSKGDVSKTPDFPLAKTNKSDAYRTALSSQETQGTQYLTATDTNQHSSAYTSGGEHSQSSLKEPRDSRDENQNTKDEGYRTDINTTPELLVSSNKGNLSDSVIASSPHKRPTKNGSLELPSDQRTEYEEAKEIYMSKGATMTPSFLHSSRSLGTIPEDGIPSDNTSQSGVTFEEQINEDTGMSFEWDDYIGEELVGRVRYTSDESPSQVEEFNEWTFDQDSRSGSETSHSKPSSIASDVGAPSDVEVTHRSKGLDTRAYVANLLTNRLSSLANHTNKSSSDQSMFYSFSQNFELDSSEHASTDPDSVSVRSMPSGVDELEEQDISEVEDERKIQEELHTETNQLISTTTVTTDSMKLSGKDAPGENPEVVIYEPHDQMLLKPDDSGQEVV